MRRAVGAILLAFLLACGSHESEPGSASKPDETMAGKPAQPGAAPTKEQKASALLDALEWADPSKPAGDKMADSDKCNQRVATDPRSQQGDFAKLVVWSDCMKELGWKKK